MFSLGLTHSPLLTVGAGGAATSPRTTAAVDLADGQDLFFLELEFVARFARPWACLKKGKGGGLILD